ncbi:methyltransferase [Kitasatospora sp. NPDC006697]|uniref:methyltransferase n=1 Tax=Kitasatospora sp. NPDC006697 TaxID=3364020 RepID=UPI0036837790
MSETDRRLVQGLLSGAWLAQACHVVAVLGVADQLAAGPLDSAELAARCEADPDALHRILRALASVGLFEQQGESVFGLNASATLLRSDVPGSARQSAVLLGEEVYRSFGELLHTARTGTPAFDHAYGEPMYGYLAAHPETARTFHQALGGHRAVPQALSACDLTGVRTVVDVGGGNGKLLADLLAGRPELHGVLLELPEAVQQARGCLAEAGVLERATLVEGSFFEQVPTGGDLYVLARCLHNWADDKALEILRTVRKAMEPGGRLVILEKVIPEGPGASAAKVFDLLMLAMVEGRNRTDAEYRALAVEAGFEIRATHPAPAADPHAESAIEAVAAPDFGGPATGV